MVLPRVFLDIESRASSGRVIVELYADKTPKTCENFRALCTGEKTDDNSGKRLCYQSALLHRIVAPEFIVQGGDLGGHSIYGKYFDDENLGWRKVDEPGLLCMANSGPNTNASQFFITLQPDLNIENCTVFGHIVYGMDVIDKLRDVIVDENDTPIANEEVVITRCGELEFKKSKKKVKPDAVESENKSKEEFHQDQQEIESKRDPETHKNQPEDKPRKQQATKTDDEIPVASLPTKPESSSHRNEDRRRDGSRERRNDRSYDKGSRRYEGSSSRYHESRSSRNYEERSSRNYEERSSRNYEERSSRNYEERSSRNYDSRSRNDKPYNSRRYDTDNRSSNYRDYDRSEGGRWDRMTDERRLEPEVILKGRGTMKYMEKKRKEPGRLS